MSAPERRGEKLSRWLVDGSGKTVGKEGKLRKERAKGRGREGMRMALQEKVRGINLLRRTREEAAQIPPRDTGVGGGASVAGVRARGCLTRARVLMRRSLRCCDQGHGVFPTRTQPLLRPRARPLRWGCSIWTALWTQGNGQVERPREWEGEHGQGNGRKTRAGMGGGGECCRGRGCSAHLRRAQRIAQGEIGRRWGWVETQTVL